VIRGRVVDSGGNSLPGAMIAILNQPVFWPDSQRADGRFDLAVETAVVS